MSIVPPLPSPIGTRYTLVFGNHFHPFGGSIYLKDGGFITVGTKDVQNYPPRM